MGDAAPDLLLTVRFLPPSVNSVKTVSHTSRAIIYTSEARNFLKRFKSEVAAENKATLAAFKKGDHPESRYRVNLKLILPRSRILSAGWWAVYKVGPRAGERKMGTKSPYKRWDASNLIKLIEDGVSEITGVDDSRFFYVSVEKDMGSHAAGASVEVRMFRMEQLTGNQTDLFPDLAEVPDEAG